MRVGLLHTAFFGDLILLSGAIEALHRSGHEINLITNENGRNIYRSDPRIQELVVIQKDTGLRKISSTFKNARMIANLNLDALIVPHRSQNSALIGFFSKVSNKTSFDSSMHRLLGFKVVLFDKDLHELKRLLKLVEPYCKPKIFEDIWTINRPFIQFKAPQQDLEELIGSGFSLSKPFIVLAPGSVWGTKIFPPEKLSLVIRDLYQTSFVQQHYPDLQVVITGSGSDRETCQKLILGILDLAKNLKPKVFDTTARIPIQQMGSLLMKASMLIGNDSAPAHLASCTNTPSVIFFGPTSPSFGFGPLSDHSEIVTLFSTTGISLACQPCNPHGPKVCPKIHHRCMQDIPEKTIVEILTKVLKKRLNI